MYLSLIFGLALCLISFFGILLLKLDWLKLKLKYLLALSAGSLLADAFFHLLPHAVNHLNFDLKISTVFVLAILLSFTLESWLRWRNCCDLENKNLKILGIMNLFGDSWCNFVDGISLAVAFSASWTAGLATGLSILLHEIPQEISDFATLIHAGFDQKKALLANLSVSLFSLLGLIFGWLILKQIDWLEPYLLVFSAGTLTYLALSNLIPEVHNFHKKGFNWLSYFLFILGIILIASLSFLETDLHEHKHEHKLKIENVQDHKKDLMICTENSTEDCNYQDNH